VGASREMELVHGLLQIVAGGVVQLAAGLQLAGAHGCVGGGCGRTKALALDVACGLDAGADGGGCFSAVAAALKFMEADSRHFDVDVDAIQ